MQSSDPNTILHLQDERLRFYQPTSGPDLACARLLPSSSTFPSALGDILILWKSADTFHHIIRIKYSLFTSVQVFSCLEIKGDSASAVLASTLWIKLTVNIKSAESVIGFKNTTNRQTRGYLHVYSNVLMVLCFYNEKEVLVTRVCLLVGLSAGLKKNYWMDVHKTWMRDGSQPRIEPINFWCGSRQRSRSRNTVRQRFFLTFSLISQGKMHRSYRMKKKIWHIRWLVSMREYKRGLVLYWVPVSFISFWFCCSWNLVIMHPFLSHLLSL